MADFEDECFWFPDLNKCKTEPKPVPKPKPKPIQTDTEASNSWEEPFISPIAG